MSYTLTESGNVLTETQDGVTMPADYGFASVNDYVHGVDVQFEDLVSLCLGMANEIDRLRLGIDREAERMRDALKSVEHMSAIKGR